MTEPLALILVLCAALAGVLGWTLYYIAHLKLVAKDATNGTLATERDGYRTLAEQGVHGLQVLAGERRAAAGLPPLVPVLATVPYHESPITQRNQDAADLGTLRAEMSVVQADLGIEPEDHDELLHYEQGVKPRR